MGSRLWSSKYEFGYNIEIADLFTKIKIVCWMILRLYYRSNYKQETELLNDYNGIWHDRFVFMHLLNHFQQKFF